MTAPVQPQGPDPEQVRQDIAKIKATGRDDLLKRYFERNGLNPDDYKDGPSAGQSSGGGITDNPLIHALLVGNRAVASGLESAVRMPSNLAAGAVHAFGDYFAGPGAGSAMASVVPGAGPNRVADVLHLPTARNAFEQTAAPVVEDAASAVPLALGSGPLGIASAIASGVGSGVAQRIAADHGIGLGGQTATGLAVGLVIPAIMHGGAATIQRVMAGAAQQRQTAQQLQTIMQQATGSDAASLGQFTQGGIGSTVDKELRQSAGGAGVFRKTLDEQSTAMGNRVNDITKTLGGSSSPERAGRAVQRGIEEGFLPRFRSQSQQLYDQAEQLVPASTTFVPQETLNFFGSQGGRDDATRVFQGLGHPFLQQWGQDLQNEILKNSNTGVTFGLLRDFRSRLGDIMSGKQAIEGLNQTTVKKLYGALSDDMRTAVAANGGPAGVQAWDRAAKHWAAGMGRIENVLQPILDKNVPEKAFTSLMSGTKDGATALRSTMRSLNTAEREVVSSTALSRLGKAAVSAQDASGEVFDPVRFVNQWATLAPESRSALFTGVNPQVVRDLNTIARAASVIKNSGQALGGPPATASAGLLTAIMKGLGAGAIGGAIGGPGTGAAITGAMLGGKAAATGGSYLLAERVFTNPRMIRWLTGTTQLPIGAMYAQMTQLSKMSEKWNAEDRALAKAVVNQFSGVDVAKMNVIRALSDATAVGAGAQ